MIKDPHEHYLKTMFLSIICMAAIAYIFGVLAYGSLSLLESSTNETEENDFEIYLENMTSNSTTFYQNITILDNEHRERSFRSDVYNVIYETEAGEIQKDNNMTLYYSVEEGHSYNVSGMYSVRGIIGEI